MQGSRKHSSLSERYTETTYVEIGKLLTEYKTAIKKVYEIALQIEDRAFSIPWVVLETTPEMKLKNRYDYSTQKVRLEVRD